MDKGFSIDDGNDLSYLRFISKVYWPVIFTVDEDSDGSLSWNDL